MRRQGSAQAAPANSTDAPSPGQCQRQDRRLRHPQGLQRPCECLGSGPGPCCLEGPAQVPARKVPRGGCRHEGPRLSAPPIWGGPEGVPWGSARDQPGDLHARSPVAPLRLEPSYGGEAGGDRPLREPWPCHLHEDPSASHSNSEAAF